MLGCEYSDLHPAPVKTPACVRKGYVGMVAYRSRLSGRLLLAGQLDRRREHLGAPVVPFMMTIAQRGSDQEDDGEAS